MQLAATRRKDRAIGRNEAQLGAIHRAGRPRLSPERGLEPARMDRTRHLFQLLFVGLLVAGMTLPVSAFPAPDKSDIAPAQTTATGIQAQPDPVSVGVGQQLSTVLAVTSDDVRTEVEETAFEVSFETEAEAARVRAVANRSAALHDRAESIVTDYDEAKRAFEAGEISASEFARRIAALNARAENVLRSYERLQERSQSVSALELRAEGVNRTALKAAIADLDVVTGAGPTALLRQFTGLSQGSVELRTNGGLRIEVEADDGERSREVTRRGDADPSFTVPQATAMDTASRTLSNRSWRLERASIHEEQGYYRFRYRLATADFVGRAEVRVDGSSGTVVRIEEVVNVREDDSDDEDEDRDERDRDADADLILVVAAGQPGPDEQITLEVRQDGRPVANATVSVNDRTVGTTDANGRIAVTLPREAAEIVAERGEAEGELEFEFEEDEDAAVFRKLDATATLDNETVTVSVTFDGRGVANATVFANDRRVGRTSEGGMVDFQLPAESEDLEVEIVKGEFEAELEYRVVDGSLVLTEEAHSGDGDKVRERDDDDDEADGDENDRERGRDDRDHDDDDDARDRDDSDRGDEDESRDLVLRIVNGDPAPGATVTLAVSQDGSPVADARVTVNDRYVGTTDIDGRIQVTLPRDEAEIRAESGEAEGELELEFEADENDEETETPEEDEEAEESESSEEDEDSEDSDEDDDPDDEDADDDNGETPTDG